MANNMDDSTHLIKRAAKRFFSGTMLSRVSGMLRDMSMAYVFGIEAPVAAFLLAFRFAHLLRRLFGEGAAQAAFIPHFEELRLTDEKKAYGFFCSLTLAMSLLLIVLILGIGGILAATLYFTTISAANREIIFLTLLLLPSLFFICLYGLNASLLQCQNCFFIASSAPVIFNTAWIAVVLSLRNMPASFAMPYLAVGVVGACILQWFWTVPQTYQFIKQAKISLPFTESLLHMQSVRKLAQPLSLGMLGVAATQINNLVDSLFARYAELEGPAILWYSIRLQQLPLALFGIAIAGAILPPLSRAIKSNNQESYRHFLTYGLLVTFAFMLPITGLILCMGDTSVNLIYGRGDFDAVAIQQTTRCLWAYGLGLLPSALVLILAPAYYANNNYKLPALISIFAMVINLVLNSLFILYFQFGAVSVAIATSISAWLNLYILGKNIKFNFFSIQNLNFILKVTLITIITTFVVILLRSNFDQVTFTFKNPLFSMPVEGKKIFEFFSQFLVFVSLWFSLAYLCGSKSFNLIFKK